jgi:sugar phosphate isomerase/epimerase
MEISELKKPQLGLKASTAKSQLTDRLKYQPEVFEFFTSETDFTVEGLKKLSAAIELVKNVATDKIILHHPMRYQGEYTELIAPQKVFPELNKFIDRSTNSLLQLAFDFKVQVLLHGSYSRHTQNMIDLYPSLTAADTAALKRLDYFAQLGQQRIMFENSLSPIFYFGNPAVDQVIYERNYRLAFDTSHCFIKGNGNNTHLLASLEFLKPHIVHYHLVDSMGEKHDSLQLGKGKINWQSILPALNSKATNIYEINLKNQDDCQEQIASHQYLTKIYQKFVKS